MLDAAILWNLGNPGAEERARAVAERELIGFRLGFAKESKKPWAETALASWGCSGAKDVAYNTVVQGRLAPERVANQVRALLAPFEGVPLRWMVLPSSVPQNAGELLLAEGFAPDDSQPLMVAELSRITPIELPAGLTYEEVRTPRRLYDWVVMSGGTTEQVETRFWAHLPLLMEAGEHHRYVIVKHDDVPVARGMLRTAGGVAGVYGVHTSEGHRRRGFGAAATLHALELARERGLKVSSLQASKMGESLYRTLGYRAVGEVRCWVRR